MKVSLKSTKGTVKVGGVEFAEDKITVCEETPELLYWLSQGWLDRAVVEVKTDGPAKVVKRTAKG